MDTMIESSTLLSDYVTTGSEAAFHALVERHLPIVLAAALPCVRNDQHLAEDAAQTAFQSLARKARSLPKDVPIEAWLYRHAYHSACKIARSETRRTIRERHYSESMHHDQTTPPPNDVCEDVPRLLAGLPEGDREVVIARYLDEKSFRTIARELRVSEDTAQKRTSRALEKMRKKLSARGIAGAAALIAETLAYQRVASVPAAVLTRVQTMAFERL
ncbi:MAG: RNA polymerase sigma factor (sigma-70 family) [Verrucomicrobiales bacterium]|jgi:RNA polymerase sigma factor (sigma-70 family)